MASLGYSQEIVRTPTRDEIASSLVQSEYLASPEAKIDLAVSQILEPSIPYGPELANTADQRADDSLESYLAGLVLKSKRSRNSLDSFFADEAWME